MPDNGRGLALESGRVATRVMMNVLAPRLSHHPSRSSQRDGPLETVIIIRRVLFSGMVIAILSLPDVIQDPGSHDVVGCLQ